MTASALAYAVKGMTALAAALLLGSTPPPGAPARDRCRFDRALAILGVLAAICWTNFGRFHPDGLVNYEDLAHNYLGAKYHRELSYTGLYRCVALAASELGHSPAADTQWIRDLDTGNLVPVATFSSNSTTCAQFSPERWTPFVNDVRLLLGGRPATTRASFYMNFGFNASPVWVATASTVISLVPGTRAGLSVLVLLDWLLLAVAAALIWWAFGWRTLCIAAIWFGTSYPTRYAYTGGALLRADWLLLSIATVACARRGYFGLAGFAWAWASLLRVFPAALAVGLLLNEAWRMWRARTRRPSRDVIAFSAGTALAVVTLVPVSGLLNARSPLDMTSWRGFVQNAQRLTSTPFTNRIGLKALVAWRPSTRGAELKELWLDGPWDTWRAAQRQNFDRLAWVFWLIVTVYLLFFARACAVAPAWAAISVGVGWVPILLEVSTRYYGLLAAYACLFPVRPWVARGLSLVAFGSSLCPVLIRMGDDIYVATSVLIVVLTFTIVIDLARHSSLPSVQPS